MVHEAEKTGQTADAAAPAAADAPNASPSAEACGVDEFNRQMQALTAERNELQDRLLRARAECDNVAKRAAAERSEAVRLAGMDVARALLPVLDNFERTLESLRDKPADEPLAQGVRLIAEQLTKALQECGVTPIEAVGRAFDPTQHEALMRDERSTLPPGTVSQELQRGYKMRDRVLRPARVAVAAEPAKPQGGAQAAGADADAAKR